MPQEQGLGDDGVDTAGSHQLGDGDEKLKRKEKQVTHPEGRLPGMPRSTRLLADGASRYDLRIRTPQVFARAPRAGKTRETPIKPCRFRRIARRRALGTSQANCLNSFESRRPR